MARLLSMALFLGLLCAPPSAQATLIWDKASPSTERGSLVSVLSDPSDPQIAWVASETRVWVTDDGGLAWYLVAQIMSSDLRDKGTLVDDEDDEESNDDESDEEEEDEDVERFDDQEFSPIADPEESEIRFNRGTTLRGLSNATPPVVRLRMIGDQVFLTGDRGVWAIDKEARTLGSAVEVRLGRAMAVRDLLQAPWGSVLVATSEGLREISDSGLAGPTRGALGERDTVALCRSGRYVVAATREDGLWLMDSEGSRRVGLAGIQGPRDLFTLPDGNVLVATSREVLIIDVPTGRAQQRWPLTSIERVGAGPKGRLWAIGPEGAWSWSAESGQDNDSGQWTLQSEGMGDRRLKDLAIPATSPNRDKRSDVHLWVVGSGGAWRRVAERVWIASQRERADDLPVDEQAPPVWELLEEANKARYVDRSHIEGMRSRGLWAATLPTLEVEYQYRIRREEDLLTIRDLDTNFVTQVQVYPNGHHVKVMALWDLYPVIWGFFETESPYTGPTLAQESVRALQERARIRSAIVGLYTLWAQQRESWRQTKAPSANAALKSILSLQHIEADLHVLTNRRFTPITTLETIQQGGTP